jgi:hypothetical protein
MKRQRFASDPSVAKTTGMTMRKKLAGSAIAAH